MSGIWNVSGAYDINTRRLFKNLTFEVGQNFLARVVDVKRLEGDVLLKLLDGWKFSAKLENNLDKLPDGLIKFQVEGYEDGQIKLKIVADSKDSSSESSINESLDFIFSKSDMNITKDDYKVFYKMVKHDIPLTKDNISYMKTFTDFIDKLNDSPKQADNFINNYIRSKNVPENSNGAKVIETELKSFFSELKNLSADEILTFMENKIDLTKENIKSFNEVFKGSLKIYNNAEDINNSINHESINVNNAKETSFLGKNINIISGKEEEKYYQEGEDISKTELLGRNSGKENVQTNIFKNTLKEGEQDIISESNKNVQSEVSASIDDTKLEEKTQDISFKDKSEIVENESSVIFKNINSSGQKSVKPSITNIDILADKVKQQINEKTENIKDIIKTVIDQNNDGDLGNYNNITNVLNKNINDFKVFNTVSNQYYYMDLPLNIDNHEYNFKLMIKDNRRDSKKLDSTDLKIAASVNTQNIGIVDAYIIVNGLNMKVDIKCDSDWVRFLNKDKSTINSQLQDMGYNIYMSVDKRKEEMNLVNCRDFFDDKHIGIINIRA
ncbi:hypothetical protein D4Z93_12355 [Clostridium fermenticellae]|uniref:Flagellar hook-length control protein FliK n=1 Tax=Clostridium fermenticellae TaxID=2068654 RepID=A0A386H6U2_9CLOT|nr:hypothetical protein [Clostridium fermenticellae]AYD41260.1 hypothetical protein D4Z93_12355 [Clostridium fermenticellae]